jgi:methionyl-tRNA formyltransferase
MLRLVFMGSDAIALPLLEWLGGEGRAQATVAGVFTQPDRPVGRGQKVQPNAIKTWALARGLPVFQPEKLTAGELGQLEALKPDLSLVMAYGHILRPEFIDAPRLGTLNLHTSVLPAYRGASPIQSAVASGETGTGVSLMRIVPALDAGPVAAVPKVPVLARDTAAEVEAKLAQACVPLLAQSLPALAAGKLTFAPQDDSRATFCRKLAKEDGVLDFTRPARELAARINGLNPWPAVTITLAGQPVKVGLADAVPPEVCHPLDDKPAEPGAVLGADAEGLVIATGRGGVRLLRLQRAGGKMLPAPEFLRGFPVAAGTLVPLAPMPTLVSREPFPRRPV